MTILTIVTIITIVFNALGALASFARAPFITDTLTEVNVPPHRLPLLATLQTAGALGLLIGLLGVPLIGLAAAIGLTLYYLGAVIAHLRAGAYRSLASPLVFLGLATWTLILFATTGG
ncbi:DoxX family protein [Pseudactinotalea sp.]|uniref:DoxX family protein n=1 Tax=Pseudactinotalea sp. TaxID=1926260 RepID=UPI003B3A93F8